MSKKPAYNLEDLIESLELADNEEIIEQGDNHLVIQETIRYTRKRTVHVIICQLSSCPYCQNKPILAKHPRRKWCSLDAREEFRRRERAREAINDGRIPGSDGRPSEEIDVGQQTIFYMLLLDEPIAESDDENAYLIGTAETQEEFREFVKEHDLRGKYDTAIMARTYQADQLASKIRQRYKASCEPTDMFDYYYLKDSDVRLAHQLTNEHTEAFNRLSRQGNAG